jgi:phenylacetate-CoA ligase
MPFIRYKLGDLVVKGYDSCPCGAPFSTIREIQGRLGEYIELPDGRSVHASMVQKPLIQNPPQWLAHYQIIQERRDLIVVEVVSSTDPPSEADLEIRDLLGKVLGAGVKIKVDFVHKISTSAGAKHMVFRSNLQ